LTPPKAKNTERDYLVNPANVLLLYTDPYYLVQQVYPFGLDLIARFLRHHGHHATIEYPFLPDPDPGRNLLRILKGNRPDVIGLGIRNLDTCLSCEPYGDYEGNDFRTFYFLPEVKKIVDIIRMQCPEVPVVAGGGGFAISPEATLNYLGLEYGIVGEGEEPFKQFVEAFPNKKRMQGIKGLVYGKSGTICCNPRGAYAFPEKAISSGGARNGRFRVAFERAGLPVQVKRGCNQACSYCVEPIIEGGKILFREMDRVVEELESLSRMDDAIHKVFFVDTEFNLPDLGYAARLVNRILQVGLHERFSFASQFLPKPFDLDFAGLLSEAGFSIILTCDSFSDAVLRRNGASYRRWDIQNTLDICEQKGLPCTLSMIFGLPGETYETIDDTIEQMKRFPPGPLRRYEYTVGGRIYSGTRLCRMIEEKEGLDHVYGTLAEGYLAPCYFCSPESPLRLKSMIEKRLGYAIAYDNRYDPAAQRSLGVVYLADQGRWEEAVSLFMEGGVASRLGGYDYLFRRLAGSGRTEAARSVSQTVLADLEAEGGDRYHDWVSRIHFYLSCLGE